MRVKELFESDQLAAKFISDRIKQINRYIKDFDALVNANGYQQTEKILTDYLNNIEILTKVILSYYAQTNSTFKTLYQQCLLLETQLRNKVKSGVSYE